MAIIQQGTFTSDGNEKTLAIRSDVDWLELTNLTIAAAGQTNAVAVEWFWQRGMDDGRGIVYKKSDAGNATDLTVYSAAPLGFTLVNSTQSSPGGAVDYSGFTAAAPPVVTTASTAGMYSNQIVRLTADGAAPQFMGMDFSTHLIDGTTFSLVFAPNPTAAGTGGKFRIIPYDPIFYPRWRYITAVTKASSAVVTTSVHHGYKVGQRVRFIVPQYYKMTELDGLEGTITAVSDVYTSGSETSTFTVDIDSSSFTTFAFTLAADWGNSKAKLRAIVVPVGEDTAQAISSAVSVSTDASFNTGLLGLKLAGGATGPAGANNDVIFYRAGKSDVIDNQ